MNSFRDTRPYKYQQLRMLFVAVVSVLWIFQSMSVVLAASGGSVPLFVLSAVYENGNRLHTFSYRPDGLVSYDGVTEYSYDESGYLKTGPQEDIVFGTDGRVQLLTVAECTYRFQWDAEGKVKAVTLSRKAGDATSVFRYDKNGNLSSISRSGENRIKSSIYDNVFENSLIVQRTDRQTKTEIRYEYRAVKVSKEMLGTVLAQQKYLINHPDLPLTGTVRLHNNANEAGTNLPDEPDVVRKKAASLLPKPKNLFVSLESASNLKLKISWTGVEGASAYHVYMKKSPAKEYSLYKTCKKPITSWKKVDTYEPGKTISFYVKAVDKKGKEGKSSVICTVKIPNRITNAVITARSDNSSYVKWNKDPLAGYYEIAVTRVKGVKNIKSGDISSSDTNGYKLKKSGSESCYVYIRSVKKKAHIQACGPWTLAVRQAADIPDTDGKYKNLSIEFPRSDKNSIYQLDARYSDGWFLSDSQKTDPDLAFFSALGAATTYDSNDGINYARRMLEKCGFEVNENFIFSKNGSENGGSTVTDNDHVRLQYGFKIIENDKKKTLVAAVIIGGYTKGHTEWISNFNLGTGKTVRGFDLAAEETCRLTLEKTKDYMQKHEGEISDVRFWLMGHSRGGAVANLAGVQLSGIYGLDKVYAYCFATPNVSKETVAYANIHNYIIPQDFMPRLAPSQWGYMRNGEDILISPSTKSESCFRDIEGKAYKGLTVSDSEKLATAFVNIAGSHKGYYKNNGTSLIPLIPADFCQKGFAYMMMTDASLQMQGIPTVLAYAGADKKYNTLVRQFIEQIEEVSSTHVITNYLAVLMAG
ncbi:MAG: hypothetical protein IKE03_08810 [Blautia sp.]|nr:hypothetical protein [Blautia sp.]